MYGVMREFAPGEGNQVRIDIPDETDPDHRLHGTHGRVVDIIKDDAGAETGDEHDSAIYRIRTNDGDTVNLQWGDFRPPIDGQ